MNIQFKRLGAVVAAVVVGVTVFSQTANAINTKASKKTKVASAPTTTSPRDAITPTRAVLNPFEEVTAKVAANQDLFGLGPIGGIDTSLELCLQGGFNAYNQPVKITLLKTKDPENKDSRSKYITMKIIGGKNIGLPWSKLGWQADETGVVMQVYGLLPRIYQGKNLC